MILIALAFYFFVYAAVMLDSQDRSSEIEESTKAQRRNYTVITLLIALVSLGAALYYGYLEYSGSSFNLYTVDL
jgi:Na+/H+ antiporter NhaC